MGLEILVNRLVESPTVEAREFVLMDERNNPRARFEMDGYSPRMIFYDRNSRERLRIGLHPDGAPSIRVGEREIPLDSIG